VYQCVCVCVPSQWRGLGSFIAKKNMTGFAVPLSSRPLDMGGGARAVMGLRKRLKVPLVSAPGPGCCPWLPPRLGEGLILRNRQMIRDGGRESDEYPAWPMEAR
jgi:hypothetical protein